MFTIAYYLLKHSDFSLWSVHLIIIPNFSFKGPQSDRLAAVGLHEDSGIRHPVWPAGRLAERTGKAGSFPGSSAEQVSDENR